MKLVNIMLVTAIGLTFATSCATKPHLVAALPASTLPYKDLTCADLQRERRLATNEVAIYTEKQKSARSRDIALNMLVLVGSGAITNDHEESLGNAKGKVEAIETVMVEKNCALPVIEADEEVSDEPE